MAEQNKTGQIQIFAKNIRGNASGGILAESRYTRNTSGGKHVQNGGGGVNNGNNRARTSIEETRVKTIECTTELDDGSANDGSRTGLQKGVLYNKSYTFQIKEFTKGEPKNPNSIKWVLSYTDPDTGQYTENILINKNCTGKQISINFSSTAYCGRNLEIKAFISEADSEGKLPIFMHNRFRWFDGKIINDEIILRVDDGKPWLINQSGTSLCGMACLFYLFARDQSAQYQQFAKELFRTGEATYNQYTAKPADVILNKNPNDSDYPKHWVHALDKYVIMPYVDYVTMASVRNTENGFYKGGDEELWAVNWPNVMTGLSEDLLGYGEVKSNGTYNPIKKSTYYHKPTTWKIIEDINKQIADGYKIILMIDSDLISWDEDNIWNMFKMEYHWVVLETPIFALPNLNAEGETFFTIDFKVYSWGGNTYYLNAPVSMEHFINNYYGYIKVK